MQLDENLTLIIKNVLKNPADFDEIFEIAFESRDANNLIFQIDEEKSRTGKRFCIIADRSHLLEEVAYKPGEWNAWPDVIPPRLNNETIDGQQKECDYWIVKLKSGRYMTGKLTRQKQWVDINEFSIDAYKEFSPYVDFSSLEEEEIGKDGWTKAAVTPAKEGFYEVQLINGFHRVVSWKSGAWTFYQKEITAYKPL